MKKELKMKESCARPNCIDKKLLLNNESVLIPNDVLTVCAEIIVFDNATTIPIKISCNFEKSQMTCDYEKLYNSKAKSDVTIVVGDKEFQAHKIIMMARSPVFTAMLTHEMVEKKSKRISIPDVSPEIFEKVLKYIYTDEVTDVDVVAADLLEAADKYQVLSLKKLCEYSLCSTLNRQNFVKRIILADRYHAEKLLKYITKCIIADASHILKRDDFEELISSSPSLRIQLLKKTVVRRDELKITYSSSCLPSGKEN